MNAVVRALVVSVGLGALVSSLGCNQLMSEATGGRWISRVDVKVINDSSRKICAVKAKASDGSVVTNNALAGGAIGIEPGKEGAAQIDEKLGKVSLEAYSCDSSPLLLAEQTVDMAKPAPMRVR